MPSTGDDAQLADKARYVAYNLVYSILLYGSDRLSVSLRPPPFRLESWQLLLAISVVDICLHRDRTGHQC